MKALGALTLCQPGQQFFFGQWCFDPGCGIVAKQRPSDAIYEVANFHSVQHYVGRSIHNLS